MLGAGSISIDTATRMPDCLRQNVAQTPPEAPQIAMPPNPPSERPPALFDRALMARRLARRKGQTNFVTDLVVADLEDRLTPIQRTFLKPALLAPDAGAIPANLLAGSGPIALERFSTLVPDSAGDLVDPEALVLPETDYDLIVTLLDLQVVNDVPGYLSRLRRHLRPDGLLLAAALGGRSLAELRSAWLEADVATFGGAFARIAPFMDVRDAGALLQRAGFALPVADAEHHVVRYAEPLALMREIKALGGANPMMDKPRRLVTAAHLARAIAAYPRDADGRIGASLEIVWMSGWAPDESQPKPLRPGSARVNLASVLKPGG